MDNNLGRIPFEMTFKKDNKYVDNTNYIGNINKINDNQDLKNFVKNLEKICIQTVESGFMTKDLAMLIGKNQKYLTTNQFLEVLDSNLKKSLN